MIAHENLVRSVGIAKVYFQQRDYTAIVMELLSTDLHNLLMANAKVGSLPDTRDALIYAIGISRGMFKKKVNNGNRNEAFAYVGIST